MSDHRPCWHQLFEFHLAPLLYHTMTADVSFRRPPKRKKTLAVLESSDDEDSVIDIVSIPDSIDEDNQPNPHKTPKPSSQPNNETQAPSAERNSVKSPRKTTDPKTTDPSCKQKTPSPLKQRIPRKPQFSHLPVPQVIRLDSPTSPAMSSMTQSTVGQREPGCRVESLEAMKAKGTATKETLVRAMERIDDGFQTTESPPLATEALRRNAPARVSLSPNAKPTLSKTQSKLMTAVSTLEALAPPPTASSAISVKSNGSSKSSRKKKSIAENKRKRFEASMQESEASNQVKKQKNGSDHGLPLVVTEVDASSTKQSSKQSNTKSKASKKSKISEDSTELKDSGAVESKAVVLAKKKSDSKNGLPPGATEVDGSSTKQRNTKSKTSKKATVSGDSTKLKDPGADKPPVESRAVFTEQKNNSKHATDVDASSTKQKSKQSKSKTSKKPKISGDSTKLKDSGADKTSVESEVAKLKPTDKAPPATATKAQEGRNSIVGKTKSEASPTTPQSEEPPKKAEGGPAKGKPSQGTLKKKKKRTFQDQVLAEILFSCRAYSLKTLAQRVKTTDVAIHHLMLSLLDKKIAVKKVFTSKTGKTKEIYWANQESKAKAVTDLFPSPGEIQAAQSEIQLWRQQEVDVTKELEILHQQPSNEEIKSQTADLEKVIADLTKRVSATKSRIAEAKQHSQPQRFGKPKTAAQLARERCPRRMKIRFNNMRDEWKRRKQKCTDFIDQLSDAMEKKPKEVSNILDLETDEMAGVKIPPKMEVEDVGKKKRR